MATDIRSESYEIAEAIAPTWRLHRSQIEAVMAPVREWMLRELDPQSTDTVLELAAGTGDTGFEAAARAGRVITSDFSPGMLEGARRRGRELGVRNVEYRVLDAERIELDTDSVDGILCRLAFMIMPDPPAAFAEARRVLRPGGRLALAVWGTPERNPFFGIATGILVARGHVPRPEPDTPGPFTLGRADRLAAVAESGGFATVRIEEIPVCFRLPDAAAYVQYVADTAGPFGLAVQHLDAAARAAFDAEARSALTPFEADGGYELPGVAVCAVAS